MIDPLRNIAVGEEGDAIHWRDNEIAALRAALDNANHLRAALENKAAPMLAEQAALRARVAEAYALLQETQEYCMDLGLVVRIQKWCSANKDEVRK